MDHLNVWEVPKSRTGSKQVPCHPVRKVSFYSGDLCFFLQTFESSYQVDTCHFVLADQTINFEENIHPTFLSGRTKPTACQSKPFDSPK